MARKKIDPNVLSHLEWLGFVRPTGLVVSAPALVRAGAILDRRDAEGQRLLRECVFPEGTDRVRERAPAYGGGTEEEEAVLPDFRQFAERVLGWSFSPKGYAGVEEHAVPSELEVPLPDYGETLRPDYAVRELDPGEDGSPWQLLVKLVPPGQELDRPFRAGGSLDASPSSRMERLLRETGVPAGLISNGAALRLLSAPRGESSGWLDFRVADMLTTAGRPISAALRLLLSERRLLSLPRAQRLTALLEDSRKFQNEVSERLAEQVLHALYEFLRGFQAAHDASKGDLLREVLAEHPDEVYRALLTVILRLVFLLYAEERDMLPEDETFLRYYSLAGLHERLREDAALYPDTMDQRHGAWAQLVALFRMVHDGAGAAGMQLPRRHGILFDPDRFPFLEGRSAAGAPQDGERIEPPLVPDGTVYRALEKLLVLDGERISYRALDVEQIGSVYETMMGFRLRTANGRSVAIRAQKKQGAPTPVDLDALLEVPPGKRRKWVADKADRKLSPSIQKGVKDADTLADLHAALLKVIDADATPDLIPKGGMVLEPSEERRRSGSHYTPRSLTEPIVRTTLRPILERLRGENGRVPRPEEILDLKVCDPAMGSGAFLVEACRQLGDALLEAWAVHGGRPELPPDEDEVVLARRIVAKRCLYGVDRNPVAVDLAKVSLWLVTLAKDHAFTFLDHAIRHGDSLVGLSRRQLEAFHWDDSKPPALRGFGLRDALDRARALRAQIREAGEDATDAELRQIWGQAKKALSEARLAGDLVVAAFFNGSKAKEREAKRAEYQQAVMEGGILESQLPLSGPGHADQFVAPFHWEIEFPEVFERDPSGFDAFIGNPPFMGGSRISSALTPAYAAFLTRTFPEAVGKSDLVAYFFRRAFQLSRNDGCLGLLATNTIRQGATRYTGLRWIRLHGGNIYAAIRRLAWPGAASVTVSLVHIVKGAWEAPASLDGVRAPKITAYLLSFGPDQDPMILSAQSGYAYSGVNPNGKGFVLSPHERDLLLSEDERNADRIFPYLVSADMNESPRVAASRYIIRFTELEEAVVRSFPALYRHLSETVRLQRRGSAEKRLRQKWWLFSRPAEELYRELADFDRVLVSGRVATHHTFTFQPADVVFADMVTVFLFDSHASFALLQSRTHEIWAGLQGSSFEDRPRYIPEDCFETFPFPSDWESCAEMNAAGAAYFEHRADLMVRNDEGLTKTYNRFHDPEERDPGILKLRELHAAMDRAVLDAYGWTDVPTDCEFLLDYEIDEDEWGNKKKPWRYRWPEEVHDDVLARLLELNAERAREEKSFGGPAGSSARSASGRGGNSSDRTGDLFQ